MNHSTVQSPVVFITGTSSGIGKALTELLLSMGNYRVVATTREQSFNKLRETLPQLENLLLLPLNVERIEMHKEIVATVMNKWERIDVLVNNAAIAYRSVVEDLSPSEEYEQFAVNYFGPMNLIRVVLPYMRKQCRGKIINVSSVAGMMAMPTMSPYSASKFALEGASEALWYEVKPWNISVTLVQPGFVRTEAFRKVRYPENFTPNPEHPYWEEYSTMADFVNRFMERALATPQSVAKVIYKVIKSRKPPLRVPATPDAWFFILLRRLFPRRLYHSILYNRLPYRKWKTACKDG